MRVKIVSFIIIVSLMLGTFGTATVVAADAAEQTVWSDETRVQNLRELGGFYLETDQWAFYPDEKHDNHLYAVNLVSKEEIKLAGFMAANLCIVDDTLYFTDTSKSILEEDEYYGEITRIFYGGSLYCVQNVSSLSPSSSAEQIGETTTGYYQLSPGDGCLYALSEDAVDGAGTNWVYTKLDQDGDVIGSLHVDEDEMIVSSVMIDGYLYLEIQRLGDNGLNDGYIMKIDRDHGSGNIEYLHGQDMHVYGDHLFYISTEDGFLYAVRRGETTANKISCCKLMSYEIEEGGYIAAVCANTVTHTVIAQEGGLQPFAYFTVFEVNGWLNYMQATLTPSRVTPTPTPTPTPDADQDPQKKGPEGEKENAEEEEEEEEEEKEKKPGLAKTIQAGIQGRPPGKEDDKQKGGEEKPPEQEVPVKEGLGIKQRQIVNRIKPTQEPVEPPIGAADPGVVVDMCYAIFKGESLSAPIFDVYDDREMEAFVEYYSEGEGLPLENMDYQILVEKMLGENTEELGFTKEQIDRVQRAVMELFASITYTREVIHMEDDPKSAYVRVHVTRMINLENGDTSTNRLRSELLTFFEQTDYSEGDLYGARRNDLIADFMVFALPGLMALEDCDETYDVYCTWNEALGWVGDPGNEPGRGIGQIADPWRGGLMTGERNSSAPDFGTLLEASQKQNRAAKYTGVKACKLRQNVNQIIGEDRETIEQYLIRKLTVFGKKEDNIVYKKYIQQIPIGEHLPGYRECKDITIKRIDFKPKRDYLTKMKNGIKDFFVRQWDKHLGDGEGDYYEVWEKDWSEWADYDRLHYSTQTSWE